ncbi:hypothetical protein SBA5_1020011 [Candidatus Sulfotelmatomonas gaucii]|uniref:Uncharacterized protein n=1 Tax=Candidatus Sulfuritelmatomonas gaucii TaxID=2043161 RepID=A0A2N9L340_9BACT|nr:hypothetical protein SBA5_1020011 [Candidatus Sulfotelmatomonas gaucii]
MEASKKLPEKLQDALQEGVLKRLPLTFLPFVNQQLREWDFLFPNERRSTESLIIYVNSRSPGQSAALFRDVVRLENEMGVRQWQFSTEEQTIRNSSQLARSPQFQQWRQAVQAVYDEADRQAMQTSGGRVNPRNRAIVIDIPASLPMEEAEAWRHWHGMGRRVKLQPLAPGLSQGGLEGVLTGLIANVAQAGGSSNPREGSAEESPGESWVIDGASSLVDACLAEVPSAAPSRAILLSYARLDPCREILSHEMNNMRKDLSDADSVYDHLRKVDVTPFCPPEVARDPAVREFVRALYLSGNGAVIFGNSFVEWAAAEALRRARPRLLAARFTLRSKPKPFTGVAVFENPDQVNPLPAVDDNPGSAVDAEILAVYIWLAAIRYEEYMQSTVCVCIAESLGEVYLIAPPEFALRETTEPLPMDRLADSLRSWLS